MTGVLLRLQWMTLRGRVVRSIRLLRQPKYLVGFVVGAAWMSLTMLRPMLRARFWAEFHVGVTGMNGDAIPPIVHWMFALFVSIFVPFTWLLPWGALGLPFREAELTMLLQAPLTRRQIIQYGLLKSEVGVLIGAFFVSLIHAGRGPLGWLFGFLATWLLFDLWHLNEKWRALFNLRQREIPVGLARLRRVLLTVALLAFYAAVLVAAVPFAQSFALAARGADFAQVAEGLKGLEFPPLLQTLCTPAYWLTAPGFAVGAGGFLLACVPLVVTLLAQREIVLRSRARFEEIALEHARDKETRKAPGRRFARISSRSRTTRPFALQPTGDPALAIAWKNLLRVSRRSLAGTAAGAALLLVVLAVVPALLRVHEAVYSIAASFGLCLMFLPPLGSGMFWNNDLRSDLLHLELLRTWPVSAKRLVAMQVASPALLSFLASVFGAGLVVASVTGGRLREAFGGGAAHLVLVPQAGAFGSSTLVTTIVLAASVLPVTGALSVLSSSLQNLATLFLPAWMAHSADRTRGIAAFGQRMISFWALIIALALALIPAAVLVTAVVLVQRFAGIPWSVWELPFLGLLAAAPTFLAAWPVVELAARLWGALDPSEELLEIGR